MLEPLSSPGPWTRGPTIPQSEAEGYLLSDVLDSSGKHIGLVVTDHGTTTSSLARDEALMLNAPVLLTTLIGAINGLAYLIEHCHRFKNGNAARLALEIQKMIEANIAPHVRSEQPGGAKR
jgi:hypothetical protein